MHTYADDRGYSFMSVLDHIAAVPGQVNVSVMYVGAIKAWHRHKLQDDYWTVLAGDLKIGLFNSGPGSAVAELRLAGPMPGAERCVTVELPANAAKAVYLGEHRPGVLRIPAGVWHGGVAVGRNEALLLYYMTRKYDPQQPDEERASWDSFPFLWGTEFK